MRVRDALALTTNDCCRQVLANIEGARLGPDPESLHQLRVGLRRLRASLLVYRDMMPDPQRQTLSGKLRRLEHAVGAARDWDVLTEELRRAFPAGSAPSEVHRLLRSAQRRRSESYREVRAVLAKLGVDRLMLQIERLVARACRATPADRPIGPFAREVLKSRHRKARRAGRGIQALDAEALHELRIEIKKLRYATEFFSGLWPARETDAYLNALRLLQDELGLLQDAAAGAALLAGLAPAKADGTERSLVLGGQWIERGRRRAHKRLAARWRAFKQAEKFWLTPLG